MLTPSNRALAEESADHYLESRKQSNQTLERQILIAVDDPIERETKRQRRILDRALMSLSQGDSVKTRQLLEQLKA